MHRLTGFDAAFIYDERANEPQHTLKIAIWSPEASARYSLERTRRFVAARLPDIPPLRWRALRVPFDLHHPVWCESGAVDLVQHVRRLGIPAPAGRRELCEVISEIASQPLHPERPLWELWMLDGYEGDKVVAVLKLSHALADGGEARTLIERLYDEQPIDAIERDVAPLPLEPVPSKARLVGDALRDRGRELVHDLPRLARRTFRVWREARASRGETHYDGRRVKLLASPPTPLGGKLSRRRAFYFTSFALEDAKDVRRSFGCTVNDVVLATAAGAVRRYLMHRRALPGLPTIAHMPASIREEEERGRWGNRISTRSLTLPSHLPDPVARLRAVSQIAREAKQDLARRRGANLEDWLRWLPPFGAKWLSRSMRVLIRLRPEFPGGVTVSSVAGPAKQLHTLGGPVERFVSVGHMKYAAGLNMTVWSYAGQLNVGLYACAEAVPDLWRVADFVNESFEELRKAAARESARAAA
jgi:WS/DGAT/MGAT family acyltransferase